MKDTPHPIKPHERVIRAHEDGVIDLSKMNIKQIRAEMGYRGVIASKNSIYMARNELRIVPSKSKLTTKPMPEMMELWNKKKLIKQ